MKKKIINITPVPYAPFINEGWIHPDLVVVSLKQLKEAQQKFEAQRESDIQAFEEMIGEVEPEPPLDQIPSPFTETDKFWEGVVNNVRNKLRAELRTKLNEYKKRT